MKRSNIESHTRSKDGNRSVADQKREGRLHNGEPANVPQTGQGNSFREVVRSTQSTVQKVREREENRDLIASLSLRHVMSSGIEASLAVQSRRAGREATLLPVGTDRLQDFLQQIGKPPAGLVQFFSDNTRCPRAVTNV